MKLRRRILRSIRRPRRRRFTANPAREVLIYERFLPFTIFAVKGAKSNYAGQSFRHKFGRGGRVTGLADGSVRLYPAKGKRLWGMFQQ